MSSSLTPSTVVAATIGTAVTGFLAYALYFDHKRRTDPEFRKNLKREARREARAARSQAEAAGEAQKHAIKQAVDEAIEEGFPTSVELKEEYFMQQVAAGESLSSDANSEIDAALCFYKALKVYPQPGDLMSIYDKTVPKPVLDVLAEMIASDPAISTRSFGGGSEGSSQHGIDD